MGDLDLVPTERVLLGAEMFLRTPRGVVTRISVRSTKLRETLLDKVGHL